MLALLNRESSKGWRGLWPVGTAHEHKGARIHDQDTVEPQATVHIGQT